eukprot:6195107-Pleurochrysis_carterae.AAC.2
MFPVQPLLSACSTRISACARLSSAGAFAAAQRAAAALPQRPAAAHAPGVGRLRARLAHERHAVRHRQRQGAAGATRTQFSIAHPAFFTSNVVGNLERQMNRARQAKITQELMEIVAGADAL